MVQKSIQGTLTDIKLSDDNKIIQSLIDSTLEMNAGDAHINLFNVNHTKDLTVVVSVYDTVKPSNMVLDELLEWAEKHDQELVERIERMALDMSWNKENTV